MESAPEAISPAPLATIDRDPNGEPEWASWPDRKLLELRFCDLHLRIRGTALETRIDQLNRELKQIGFRFKPFFWISVEWFTPDGVPGCAAPFYLIHPRLAELELRQVGEVEGGTAEWCMRILRHETGHAIDNAYQLRRRKRRQKLFGSSKIPYPEYYEPRPYSRSIVRHLEPAYALSHPDEDFAETFAVWMTPHSSWRQRYANWPAIKKLEYMDELMNEVRRKPPMTKRQTRVEPISELTTTLGEHYEERRNRLGLDEANAYDRDLKRLFPRRTDDPDAANSAAAFIATNQTEMISKVTRWSGEYKYLIKQVLSEIQKRCVELRLAIDPDRADTMENFTIFLTAQTMKYILKGRHREWL